ncbi:hypothetical protein [Bacillus cereus]|uniref:cyanobactin maturation protease PatG family protein n=1 Tax=Bacillus cereus TaxID=1396 RepID=UPI001C3E9E5D|nr:hypothetical protein [Bacillus cereus]
MENLEGIYEMKNQTQGSHLNDVLDDLSLLEINSRTNILPQCGETCNCGGKCRGEGKAESEASSKNPSYVYALGRIEPRFPSLAIEKEFAQAIGRSETAGLTDRQALQSLLSKREYRYLVRQICWVLNIEGMETYILQPRDPLDFDLLVESLYVKSDLTAVDVVIGIQGPIAPPEMFNGLMLPTLFFDQIYSFDVETLIKSIPRPEKIPSDKFEALGEELFMKIIGMTDNAGSMDEYRALNYLSVRYPAIYAQASDYYRRDCALTSVEARLSKLSGVRKIIEVIFSYTNRNTDFTEKTFVRVDVTEEFPFLVTKLSPYYDR